MSDDMERQARAALSGLHGAHQGQVLALIAQRTPSAILDAVDALYRHQEVLSRLLSRAPEAPVRSDAPPAAADDPSAGYVPLTELAAARARREAALEQIPGQLVID